MAGRLAEKVAMVTGGASGFGRGIVEAFVAEGARVMIADIDEAAAQAAADTIGGSAEAVAVDVCKPADLAEAVRLCEAVFGGLDVMVANAGVGQRPTPFADTKADLLERQFAVNAVGVAQTCQAALPALRKRPGGNIVITVSGIALLPRPGLYGYGMAKSAAQYLMKALALELAPEGIRVNGLFPAVGDTPMLSEFMGGEVSDDGRRQFAAALPLGKLISPQDVGLAAVFLASAREAGNLTGCALPVDGGRCI